MVIRILKSGLEGVVIHIGHGQFRLDLRDSHSLKFQVGHGSRGVLGQGLVDLQCDLAALGHVAGHKMGGDDLLCDSLTHGNSSP